MRVAFHTLGCKVNQYETEAMKEQFSNSGYEIVPEDCKADVYIINTCTVTSLADRKSRQYIRKMKKISPDAVVAVTGCYAQVSRDEVAAVEGVNLVIGTNEKVNIVEYVTDYINCHRTDVDKEHVLEYQCLTEFREWGNVTSSDERTRAYVKIQEGCNRFCSYCIIPYARGPVRSRKYDDVIGECRALINEGFKEIVLTGINTALCENLYNILDTLDNLDGDFRIRLSSLEPTVVNAEFVRGLFRFRKLCHHLHLSMQAGSDKVLKAMNRRYNRDEYLEIVRTLYEFDPQYGITTDIIVGFPGENEIDFEDTLDMVERCGFCRVHTFKYSKRKGTVASQMDNQISPSIKKERSERLIEKSEKVSNNFCMNNVGTYREVLFEEYSDREKCITGYTDNYIRAYLPCNREKSLELVNTIRKVYIEDVLNDGVKVSLK